MRYLTALIKYLRPLHPKHALYATAEALGGAANPASLANASCVETKRPIYVLHTNSGTLIDTYAAHYVDTVWNGGWWYFHVTHFRDWSRYSLSVYLRPSRNSHYWDDRTLSPGVGPHAHGLWSGDM